MYRRSMEQEKQRQEFPLLESVLRISRIPFVDSGLTIAGNVYTKIKTSNQLLTWGLDQAEHSIYIVLDRTKPAVAIFSGPISLIDSLVCKSLDLVEDKVPVVTFPPELIYVSTKDYVSNTIVRPVMKRADSVKQFGLDKANTVLASKYTNYAANRLDSALNIADKYVDQYLPADATDGASVKIIGGENIGQSQAAHTMHHVDVFSRKLQRRLTRRTIAEAKALKKQSVDAIQFMINMAELLAKDPKAAMEKMAILWAHLSEDEPENQARPQNLEQLTVMVSREMARRIVHLVNFTRQNLGSLPHNVKLSVLKAVTALNQLADTIVKKTHLEDVKDLAVIQTKNQASKLQALVTTINSLALQLLESLASNIAGKKEIQANGSVNTYNSNNSHSNNHKAEVNNQNQLHNSFE